MPSALVLGGHSFIRQLGNDPEPDRAEAARIVAACLEHGIVSFDTTYLPERVRLGQALRDLGGRPEAKIVVWNFFDEEHADGSLGGPAEWTEERFAQARRECGREIAALVVHPLADAAAQARQEALARRWLERGEVASLGTWEPAAERLRQPLAPYAFFVKPCNPARRGERPLFALARQHGWQPWACSPFVRGYDLDKAAAAPGEDRAVLAADLLRYARHAPGVERLIVSMRHSRLVAGNVAAEAAGALPAGRCQELERLLPP